jgi:hypothetical protein
MKKSGKIGSKMLSSITRTAFVGSLALWLIIMLILTSITAEGMYSRSLDNMANNAENTGIQVERGISGIAENTLPGYREYALYRAVSGFGSSTYDWWSSFPPTGHISPLAKKKGYTIDTLRGHITTPRVISWPCPGTILLAILNEKETAAICQTHDEQFGQSRQNYVPH